MKPKSILWEVGKDILGRNTTLEFNIDYQQRKSFTLKSNPTSQQDEGETAYNLSYENLQKIAEVVKAFTP